MFKIEKLSGKIISFKQFLFFLSLPVFLLATAAAQTGLSTEKLIDTAAFYKKIKLQDNFYLHVNGNWMLSHPVPASKSYWGNTSILDQTNLETLNELYEEIAVHAPLGSNERLLGNLYLSSMDTVLIEAKGYEPIKDKLLHLDSLEDNNTILNEIANLQTEEGISD